MLSCLSYTYSGFASNETTHVFCFAFDENRHDLWASSFYFHDEARVPPGLETGKHFVGWQSCSSVKEM